MTFAYATTNLLTGLAASRFTISTGAGPANDTRLYLNDGHMDIPYYLTAGTTTEAMKIDLGSAQTVCGWAILNHNISALGGGSIQISHSPDDITYTSVKSASTVNTTVPKNKDTVLQFAAVSRRYWKITFTHATSSALQIGELYCFGTSTTLTRGMTDGSGEGLEIMSVGVQMMYGETRSTFFGGPRRTKRLRWQDFTMANMLELQTMWLAAYGNVNPFLWIESYEAVSTAAAVTEQDCIFGRFTNATFDWSYVDYNLVQPDELMIRAMGREIGA